MFSDEAPIQSTNVSPTSGFAPNSTGTSMQRVWLMVNEQTPFFVPGQVVAFGVTLGSPQHFVFVRPGFANGFTVTGTQTETF